MNHGLGQKSPRLLVWLRDATVYQSGCRFIYAAKLDFVDLAAEPASKMNFASIGLSGASTTVATTFIPNKKCRVSAG